MNCLELASGQALHKRYSGSYVSFVAGFALRYRVSLPREAL